MTTRNRFANHWKPGKVTVKITPVKNLGETVGQQKYDQRPFVYYNSLKDKKR